MPRWFRRLGRAAVLSAVGVLLATYTLGPLRQAQWSMVDDHEIASFVGPSGTLSFREIPEKLRQTEVGSPGRYPRFRPSYYGLRLIETALWGFDPAPWYRARVILYSVSVLLVGWLLAARIGLLATVGWLVWVLSGRYWFHVWGRLGPAEPYALLGMALWLWGIHLLWPVSGNGSRSRVRVGLALFVAGNAIVVGTKETLLVIAAANAILAAVEMRAGRTGGARWWACVAGVAIAAAVAIPLIAYLRKVGVDQYGRPVGVGTRLDVLARGLGHLTGVHVAFVGALGLWVGTRMGRALGAFSPREAWLRLTSRLVLASAVAAGFFLAQYVLYNGNITADTHYEFPVSLVGPALLVVTAILVRGYLREEGRDGAERAVYRLTAVVLAALALLSVGGLQEQRKKAGDWANATRIFTTTINRAAAAARAAPDLPVVVASGRPIDLEYILAVGRFLHALGCTNRLFLVLDWESRRPQWGALEMYLAPVVETASREGKLGYEPIRRYDAGAPCLSLGLSTSPRPSCRGLGRLS